MASRTTSADPESARAPRLMIPNRVAMTVEHPCVVKNVDRACEMIGGPFKIARSLKAGSEAPLHLRFQPDDLASRPMASTHRTANNILLQVTVPKRTGRKRKRGSDEPFVEDINNPPPLPDAQYLIQSMQDNPKSYSVTPVASISSAHIWRKMPDFVYSTAQSEFLNEIRSKVLPNSYPLMKQYQLPQTYGLTNTEVIPPAQLSSHRIQTNYSYRSNPLSIPHPDPETNLPTLYHTKSRRKNHTISVQWYSPFPNSPAPGLPPLTSQPPAYQHTVAVLHDIFAARPIWTRRALINQLPEAINLQTAHVAVAYVAFTIRSGPWRDTICRLGVDPRTSPDYRIYQSIALMMARAVAANTGGGGGGELAIDDEGDENDNDNEPTTVTNSNGIPPSSSDYINNSWRRSGDVSSHIFTGHRGEGGGVSLDGSTWQVCDILDPKLADLVTTFSSVPVRADSAAVQQQEREGDENENEEGSVGGGRDDDIDGLATITSVMPAPSNDPSKETTSNTTSHHPLCEARTRGYFPAGAWAKLKLALKAKIDGIVASREDEYEASVDHFLQLPDEWDGRDGEGEGQEQQLDGGDGSVDRPKSVPGGAGWLGDGCSGREVHWAMLWRGNVREMLGREGRGVGMGRGVGGGKRRRRKGERSEENGLVEERGEMSTTPQERDLQEEEEEEHFGGRSAAEEEEEQEEEEEEEQDGEDDQNSEDVDLVTGD